MKEQLIRLITSIIAAMIIMIVHEMPKTLLYHWKEEKNKKLFPSIIKMHHFIDPIGLLLCVTSFAGFSKPYMYRIKNQKMNYLLGITGFLSLSTLCAVSIFVLKSVFHVRPDLNYPANISTLSLIGLYLVYHLAIISIGMIFVNLFPIATFDMGHIIAGKSPARFFFFIRNDYVLKITLIILIMLDIPTVLSLNFIQGCLSLLYNI